MTFALIYSYWAFRSGFFEPSFALRLDWRENPSFTNSLRTVSALIGCPISVRAAASFSMLFDTQIKGRMGSPSVAGSTSRWSAGSSPGSFSQTARRPPPARRTCPLGNGSAPRSALPRLIVERASPVIFDTRARPPHPAVRTTCATRPSPAPKGMRSIARTQTDMSAARHLSSRRGGTHGICLCRATFAERLLTPDRRVLSRLVLDLPIQFRADQNYDGGNPQPHHQADCGPKRAIGRVVIGEVTQIPREQYRAD